MKVALANVSAPGTSAFRDRRPGVAIVAAGRRRGADEMSAMVARTRNWSARAHRRCCPICWLASSSSSRPLSSCSRSACRRLHWRSRLIVPLFDLAAGWAGLKDFVAQLSRRFISISWSSDAIYLSVLSQEPAGRRDLDGHSPSASAIRWPTALRARRAAWQPLLVMAVVLPFWTSFLIRVYAWINILQRDGLLNEVLLRLHVIDAPVVLAVVRHRGLYRHGLFLFAVHGAAALRHAREDGRKPAGSRGRSRLPAHGGRSGW